MRLCLAALAWYQACIQLLNTCATALQLLIVVRISATQPLDNMINDACVSRSVNCLPDNRVRPPEFTLIMLCPIIAQPPIPPRKPVATFATPCPIHSVCVSVRVSVISSTNCCVRSVSIKPTAATLRAIGKRRVKVDSVAGTCGMPKAGRPPCFQNQCKQQHHQQQPQPQTQTQ